MLNQQTPKIRQTIFHFDKNRRYLFDVNQNITIHTLKKMIIAAANLGKINVKIFHEGIEYTDKDTFSLDELFPNLQVIDFTVQISYDNIEDLDFLIKLKLKNFCNLHNGKFPYFYCFTCGKSICSLCLGEGSHNGHNIKEKYDYLQNSKNLIEMLFFDLKDILDKAKNVNENSVNELRNKVNLDFFPKLIEMVKLIQNKMINIINFYLQKEKRNFNTIQNNVVLLKNNCAEGLDKLKSEIEIEDMMIDENIFLTFDKKFKDIASEKNKFEEDVQKFKEYSETLYLINNIIQKSYNEIYNFLNKYLNGPELNEINETIKNQNISVVDKKAIFDKLLSDIKKNKDNSMNYYPSNNKFDINENDNLRKNDLSTNQNFSFENVENKNDNNQNNNFPTNNQPKIMFTTKNIEKQNNNKEINEKNNQNVNNNNNLFLTFAAPSTTKKDSNPYPINNNLYSENLQNQNTEIKPNLKLDFNNNSNIKNNQNNYGNLTTTTKKSYLEEEDIGTNEKKRLENQANIQYQLDKTLMKIGNVIQKSNHILIYNSIKNIIRRKTLDFSELLFGINNFLNECAWVNFKNKLYIMGGENKDGTASNLFLIYDTIKSTLIRGPNSKNEHLSHTLIANDDYIYSIGGKNLNCERYSFAKNEWSDLPSLNKIQQYPILYFYQHYIYAFFGLNQLNEPIDIIQRLNLNNVNAKWEEFQYIRNNINCKFYNAGIIEINPDEIYFMGGKDENGVRNNVIHFNFKNKTFSTTPFVLEEKVCFKESFLLKIKKDVYGNFSMEKNNPFLQINFDSL